MRLTQRDEEGLAVLDVDPPATGDYSRELFLPQIESLLAEGERFILLNISRLRWINSTDIGLLVAAHRKVEELNGRFLIVGPNRRIKELMRVVGMLKLWEVFESEDDARAALEKTEREGGK